MGLVAGIVFGGSLAAAQHVRLNLAVLGHGFVLALLAWVAYSILDTAAGADPEGWFVFLHETLAAITVAGIVALPLALLPVRGLTGHAMFRHSRRVWAFAYGIGLLAFLLVLVPLPSSWGEVPISFVGWFGLFIAYVVVAVLVWLVVVKPWKSDPAEGPVVTADVSGSTR